MTTRLQALLIAIVALLGAAASAAAAPKDPQPQRYHLQARASELDPRAKPHPEIDFVFEKDGKPADVEHASVDTRVKPRGRLVVWLMDYNDSLFTLLNEYGLHAVQPHYANKWFGILKPRDRMDRGNVRLEAATGRDVWSADGPKGTSWSTPFVWTNAGVEEIVTAGQGMIVAFSAVDGRETWRFGGIDTSFACSPVADSEGIYFGTSSPGSKAPAAAIAAGCAGDLTLAKGETTSARVRWSRTKCGAGMPSPVVVGDHLFFLDKVAVCLDKRTGEEKYRKRLPGGTTAVGSPLVVGDRIYLVNERGRTVVLKAAGSFEVLAESSLGDPDEVFWATPAVTGDAILIRSTAALYCIK